jgi:phage repressor protein C with HTH and peptisase S24 domain
MSFVADNLIKWRLFQAGTVQMFDEGSCSESEPFALQVQGDSMEPEFKDGCVIIIEPGGFIENECYVVAQNSDGLIFRQLFIEGELYILRPLNPEYDEEEIEGMRALQEGNWL